MYVLQQLRKEFWTTLEEAASSSSQFEELGEPADGVDTERWSIFPPRVTWLHNQHMADYVHIFMD